MPEETHMGSRGRLHIEKNSRGYNWDFTLELSSPVCSRETLDAIELQLQEAAGTWKNEIADMVKQFEQDDARFAKSAKSSASAASADESKSGPPIDGSTTDPDSTASGPAPGYGPEPSRQE